MTLKERMVKKYALSEVQWTNLKSSVLSALITDLVLMVPMMLGIMFVADLLGNNEYDYGLNNWVYVGVSLVFMLVILAVYMHEYRCCFHKTYLESRNIRIALAEKLRRIPLSYFSKKDPTDLSVRVIGDVTTQESLLSHWLPSLLAALVFMPVIGIMTLVWSPAIGIAIVWPIPFALLIVAVSGKVQKKYNKAKFDSLETVNEMIQESLECGDDLKANDAQDAYYGRMEKELDAVEGAEIRSEFVTAVFVVGAQLLLKLGLGTTAVFGAVMFVNGDLPLIFFIAALIIVARIYEPVNSALIFMAASMSAEINCERIGEIYGMKEQSGSKTFEPKGYDIVFENVGFSYNRGEQVLKDVSFTAKQGEVTALVGPSGEGKSTVARLCTRFWDIDTGRITVGGVDISTVEPETLMSAFSVVFQDVVLFNTTVMENIRLGRKGATDEEVMDAARKAMCDEFVSRLPDGYNTVIGENGSKLSGGERQRISIARAILKDAPVIIMDEATASLDTESESRVQQALSELIVDKTVLIIAHRMRTVQDADRIIVLKGGTVAEQGSPKDLVDTGGLFADMVRIQSGSADWSL